MRPRNDILAVFSTFIQFAEDRFDCWFTEPRLTKSMQRQRSHPESPEQELEGVWALHWYRLLDHHPYAKGHLWAYLQEPCYRAADQVTRRFTMVQYSVADGFQIAIAHTQRILKRYNPDYGSSLKAYANTAFGNCIRDHLRQQQEIHISSDWGLLRRVSQVQLTEALLTAGFVHTSTSILIWQCFRAVCTPTPDRTARGLSAPSEEQLHGIVQRFNQLQQLNSDLNEGEDTTTDDTATKEIHTLNTQQIMGKLIQLASIIRSYLNPTITSLNQPQYDDSVEEQLDTLTTDDTPMVQLLAVEAYAEQQQRIQQISIVLEQALVDLPTDQQTLLILYYQKKLTQSGIAKQLNIKQYQVSRQLNRIRR
ncbi:MAG: sigma-70 family RNA polymerase sigma factor, partial [Cyanobacteria bacterium P01_D01_bin.56]